MEYVEDLANTWVCNIFLFVFMDAEVDNNTYLAGVAQF
jgi:hypothetical protein